MTEQKVWRFPGDSREDRAKRVAHSYRALVERIAAGTVDDPGRELYRLDQAWMDNGCFWVKPDSVPLELDEWMNAKDMAHMVDRAARDIYDWAARKKVMQRLASDGSTEYSVRSVVEYMQQQRQRRMSA